MGGSVGSGATKSSKLHYRMAWIPPFLVGFAGAAAAEMAVGLLLYSTEGFLRALTVVLVTELSALGVGFLSSRRVKGANVDGLRRRWLLAVFAFAAAAVFAGAWGLSPGSATSSLSQGLGLALLAGLPLFSVGAVLGSLTSSGDHVAAPASFGGALGLLFTGLYGVPTLQPASLFLLCVVVVSAGALLHGWRMDRSVRILSWKSSKASKRSHEPKPSRRSSRSRSPGTSGPPGTSSRSDPWGRPGTSRPSGTSARASLFEGRGEATQPRGQDYRDDEGGRESERAVPDPGASGDGPGGLRWERRVRTTPRSELRILFDGESVADGAAVVKSSGEGAGKDGGRRKGRGRDGDEAERRLQVCLPWQRHVLAVLDDAVPLGETESTTILVVGVGTGALLASLEARGWSGIVAFEPREGVVLPEDRGGPEEGEGPGYPRPETPVGRDWRRVSDSAPGGRYDVVLINLRLLPRNGPFHELDHELLEDALALRSPDGIALLGGLDLRDDRSVRRTLEWLESRCGMSPFLYRPGAGTWSWEDEPWEDLLPALHDQGGGLVICRPDPLREEDGPEGGSEPGSFPEDGP